MGVYHSAKLVYGVRLEDNEITTIAERSDFNDIFDKWLVYCNTYDPHEDVILGVIYDSVDEGESAEVCIKIPTGNMNNLLETLNKLGINREPNWHLICQVS